MNFSLKQIVTASAITSVSFGSLAPLLHAAPPVDHVQLLVKPKVSMKEAALHALLSAQGASEHNDIPALNVRVIRVPAHAADKVLLALQKNNDVEYAERDMMAHAIATSNDPHFTQGNQWYLSKIEAPAAWNTTTGSSQVIVAVLDTGVLATHPDISGKVLAGYDFVNNDANATDDNGHGTAVAGFTSASTNNGVGMAAVSWASSVLPVKVLGADGSGSHSAIANGIVWAADKGARVINLSLGGSASSQTLQDAVNYAWNRNVIVIAAAGNNGNNTPVYPAAYNNVVAVSATTSTDGRPSWSNYGSYVDLSAPGAGVLSLSGTNSYTNWNGTSFSSPVTAGVVALMLAANPQLSNTGIVDALLKNCDDTGSAGYDVYFGNGRVNARRAVAAVTNTSTPTDTTAPTVAINSPSNGATLSNSVNVNVSASDNVGVTRIELYIGGVLYGQSSSSTATFTWNTNNSLDGSYTLQARAYDAANNVKSTSIGVNVKNSAVADTIAPVVAITSPKDGTIISRKTKTLNIAVAGSDNVKVTRIELYINGYLAATSTSGSPTFNWYTNNVARGTYRLQAYAYDAAGNIGSSYRITVYK
ncbi:MAG: S8 family serine peptidase [Verrucomicrobiota bacterium]